MAVLGSALVALMWSSVIVLAAGAGNLIAGTRLSVTTADLAVLTGVLWAIAFLALVVMDAGRRALGRQDAQRPGRQHRQAAIDLRFTIAVMALSLAMGSITMRYLGGGLTVGRFVSAVVYYGGVATIAAVVVEAVRRRRRKSAGP